MHSPHNRGRIHFHAALLHHLHKISITDAVLAATANKKQDDLTRKATALEHDLILTPFQFRPYQPSLMQQGRVGVTDIGRGHHGPAARCRRHLSRSLTRAPQPRGNMVRVLWFDDD